MPLILFQFCQRQFVSQWQKLRSPDWHFQSLLLLKYLVQKFRLLLVQGFPVSLVSYAQDLLLSLEIQFVLLQVLFAEIHLKIGPFSTLAKCLR